MNVSNTKNCFGCGVCATVCPQKIINIELNKKGFYEPRIFDETHCTQCGLCVKVCAYNDKGGGALCTNISAWAAWSNDENVRQKCSSGGVGFEILKTMIEKGYKAVGCQYNVNNQRAEHYIATNTEELLSSIGSKYMQSYTFDAFINIDKKSKYVVIGTPCQIASFRKMIHMYKCEENFVLIDFYCHSVPSMHVWKNYMKMLESQVGRINYASWRNKFHYEIINDCMKVEGSEPKTVDWHDSYNILVKGNYGVIQSRMSHGDWYYKMFLGDICPGIQCIKSCRYKYNKSAADIRIGDLWGNTYKDNKKGVSALVAFSDKGRQIINDLQNVTLVEHPFEIVVEGQMKKNVGINPMRGVVMLLLSNKIYLTKKQWNLLFILLEIPIRSVSKIQKIIEKIWKLV